MSAISVMSFTAALGKMSEAQALLKETLQILQRFGAKGNVNALVRGGPPGTLSLVT